MGYPVERGQIPLAQQHSIPRGGRPMVQTPIPSNLMPAPQPNMRWGDQRPKPALTAIPVTTPGAGYINNRIPGVTNPPRSACVIPGQRRNN